jgi:hypothetical protein
MADEAVKITVRPNGPLRVEGPISLTDADGRHWDLTGKPAISRSVLFVTVRITVLDFSARRVRRY